MMSATICKQVATGTNKAIGKKKASGKNKTIGKKKTSGKNKTIGKKKTIVKNGKNKALGKNKATTKTSGGKWPAVVATMASSRGHNLIVRLCIVPCDRLIH